MLNLFKRFLRCESGCGVVGIARGNGSLTSIETMVFAQMLDVAKHRGLDSTGIAVVGEPSDKQIKKMKRGADMKIAIRKDIISAWPFLNNDENWKWVKQGSRSAYLGHTRKATVGKISVANAHPFEFPNVVGMANGTFWKEMIPGHDKYETDTEALFALMNETSPEEAFAETLGIHHSPLAAVYINKKLHTLEIVRNVGPDNDTRPLVLAQSEDKSTLLWASEPGMIVWATGRNDYKLSTTWKYASPLDKKIYRFPLLEDPAKWINAVEIIDIKVKARPFVYSSQKSSSWVPSTNQNAGSLPLQTVFPGATPAKYPILDWRTFRTSQSFSNVRSIREHFKNKKAAEASDAEGTWPVVGVHTGTSDKRVAKMLETTTKDITTAMAAAHTVMLTDDEADVTTADCGYGDEYEARSTTMRMADGFLYIYDKGHDVYTRIEEPKKTSVPVVSKAIRVEDKSGKHIPIDEFGHDLTPEAGVQGEPDSTRRGPMGTQVSATRFRQYLDEDCAVCGDPMDHKELTIDWTMGWTKSGGDFKPICPSCNNGDGDFVNMIRCDNPADDYKGKTQ